ncbi:MAG: hypothetical protein VW551_04930 [Euryarchaeota archaeon]
MYQVQGNVDIDPNKIEQGISYGTDRIKWKRPQLMVWADNEGTFGNSGSVQGNTYPWGREGENFIITSDHNRSSLSVDQLRLENRMRMVGGNMRSYYTGQKVTLNCSWSLLPSRAYQRQVYVGERTTPYSQWPYGQPRINDTEWSDGDFFAKIIKVENNTITWQVGIKDAGFSDFRVYRPGSATPIFTFDAFQHQTNGDGSYNYVYTRNGLEQETNLRFNMIGGDFSNPVEYNVNVSFSWEGAVTDTMPTSEFTADGGAGGADLLQWYRNTHGPFWVYLSYDNYPNFEGNTDIWNQFDKYSDRYMMYFTSFNYSVEKRGLYDMWNVSVSLEEA